MTVPQNDLATLLFARADPAAELNAAIAMAASIARTLRMATSLANAGRQIDIAGLDDWVGRLTARTLDLEPAEAAGLRLTLLGLVSDLDHLERILGSQRS